MSDEERRSSALDQVLELTVLLSDDMTRSLARDGLTPSRAHVLWELSRHGPMSQRDLAAAMQVSPRNVTGLVDALVSTGFVVRQPHPTDRRATLVAFTDHGSATADALVRGRRELADQLFGAMSPERFDCFVVGLDDVLARLRALVAEAKEAVEP